MWKKEGTEIMSSLHTVWTKEYEDLLVWLKEEIFTIPFLAHTNTN